jgi:2'-5' RNA ligase
MRLFVAVAISDETRAALRHVRLAVERAVAAAPVPPKITWVNESAAHVTVRFIGDVDEASAAAAAAALSPPIALAAFDVRWATVGVFPPGRAGRRCPRAIWIGAAAGAEQLADIAAAVNHRLQHSVGAGDERPYSPHLTVGRVRLPGKGVDWAEVIAAARPAPSISRVDRLTLYRSDLSSRGPTYTPICRVELSG